MPHLGVRAASASAAALSKGSHSRSKPMRVHFVAAASFVFALWAVFAPQSRTQARELSGNLEQGTAGARTEGFNKRLQPKPAPEAVRSQVLDTLFERLREARHPEEAQRIAASIERLWLRSQSDTANLLMQRAMAMAQAQQYPLALSLFDKLVALEPNWAEAWNQRAMAKFLSGDMDGAMADINKAIKLEPRHFGALEGMGMILQQAGLKTSALEIFKKALEIYPLAPDLQNLIGKLTLEAGGQDI